MTIDPAVIPGLLLVAAEIAALAAVGYVVVRVALRQSDERVALAQGLVVGLALWGLIVNFVMYAVPGLAGAIVGWGVVLGLGGVLAWRSPQPIRPRPRVTAGFIAAFLALFWAALASRQLLSLVDSHTHLGLAASIRAGMFPPELSISPGQLAYYHHGLPLLVGLLAPPVGPDLAFVIELLAAYVWASFALVVTTLLLQRATGLVVAVVAPLLLTAGAWTFIRVGDGLLTAPVPTGLPAAGLRASLTDIYWPSLEMPWGIYVWEFQKTVLANIWKPGFTLGYALVVVVLERATGRGWGRALSLAGLVGFLGLLNTTLTPVVLALWAGLEAVRLGHARLAGALTWRHGLRPGVGLALAGLLVLLGGGRFTGVLAGAASPGLTLGWSQPQEVWHLLGTLSARTGGVGVLGVGPVVAASAAALLARRDRLVLTLAVGAGVLALGYVALHYSPKPTDLDRLAGHARNLALLALLLALSGRLAGLRPRWRHAASALLVGLVVWPTVGAPVRYLGRAVGQGIEVSNARPGSRLWFEGRYSLEGRLPADRIAAYVRDHTPVDARVLTPEWPYLAVTFATGRPSAAGFVGHRHVSRRTGPTYRDAVGYLEPAALRRLGIGYVHATDAWVAGLPQRAARWLADPALFELLTRDGGEALYRVRPAFLALDPAPAPSTYEALRRGVPASTTVYLPARLQNEEMFRVASGLFHARLLGISDRTVIPGHFLTPWPTEPLGALTPDLVMLRASMDPWMFPSSGRQPIWWNDEIAVYAPRGAVAAIMPPPPAAAGPPPAPVSVQVSDVRAMDGRIAFTVTIDDHTPDQWTGQDWRLVAGEASPWAIPTELEPDRRTPVVAQWFAGQMAPGRGTTTRHYVFDAHASRLALHEAGRETVIATSSGGVGEGIWTLSLRLLRAVDRGAYVAQEEAAVIPLMQIEISATGEVTGFAYDRVRGAEVGRPASA